MGGENCTCPKAPCPVCHTKACECGCGYAEFSEQWQYIHVESLEQLEQRKAQEEALRLEVEEEMKYNKKHPWGCFCVECDG